MTIPRTDFDEEILIALRNVYSDLLVLGRTDEGCSKNAGIEDALNSVRAAGVKVREFIAVFRQHQAHAYADNLPSYDDEPKP